MCLAPHLPEGWDSYSFRFLAGDGVVLAHVDKAGVSLSMLQGTEAKVKLFGEWKEIRA